MLNAKTLKRLVILTTICAVPVTFVALKNGSSMIKSKNALFMPGLMNKPDQITKVTLQDQTQTLTLQKVDSGWQMLEHDNYPVITDRVKELLYSLADLRIVEPKTTNEEYFRQLSVSDITEAGSDALLITVSDMYNDALVKILIGKREGIRLGEEYQEHIFVRKLGEDQAWLVQGVIPLSNDFRDWVDQPLISLIESEQIKSLEIDRPKADKIIISKLQPEQEDFSINDLRPRQGMVLDLDAINTVPFEISELEFTNVHPVTSKINLNGDWGNAVVATLDTFPGVKVILHMLKDGDKILAKVEADALPTTRPDLIEKVLAFNAAKRDWIFELSPAIYKELLLPKSDFLKAREN